MIIDGYVNDYDSADLNSNDYEFKDVVKIISTLEIINVQNSMFTH